MQDTGTKGNDGASPRRPTHWQTAERRARAWELHEQYGIKPALIAQELGVHPSTVSRWLAAEAKRLARQYGPGSRFDPARMVALLADRYQRTRRMALSEFHTSREPRTRLRALVVVLRADDRLLHLLQSCGLVPATFGTLVIDDRQDHFSANDVRRMAEEVRAMLAKGGDAPSFDDGDDFTPAGERRFLEGHCADEPDGKRDAGAE